MISGQRPKSAGWKMYHGNPGHDSEAELKRLAAQEPQPTPIAEIPDPPRKLKAEGRKEWDRVVGELVETRRLSAGGLSILATYCNLHAQIVKLEKRDEIPPASLLAQYRMLAESFGLTPQSRVRTKTLSNGEEKSGIRGFIDRKRPTAG